MLIHCTLIRANPCRCTKDFRVWPAPKLIFAPDPQDPVDICFYGANYFPYPGRSSLEMGEAVVLHYHRLPFLRVLQCNLAVVAAVLFENDGAAPGLGRSDLHCMTVPLFHRAAGTMDSQVWARL